MVSYTRMENFIRLATLHSAQCGKQLVLIRRDMNCRAKVHHVWKSPCCSVELSMDDCDMVRSPEVAQGAGYSWLQLDFNLRLVKGIQLTGINTAKLLEFMEGELGIKIASEHNLRQQITKVQRSIANSYEDWKTENQKEHVLSVR